MYMELFKLMQQFDGDELVTFTGPGWAVSDIEFPNLEKGSEFSDRAEKSGLITQSVYISTYSDGTALFSVYS